MNTYWSYGNILMNERLSSALVTLRYSCQLTKVCTIFVLLLLISLTNSKMSMSFFSFSLSIIASRVMKVPVRPTPALHAECRRHKESWSAEFILSITQVHCLGTCVTSLSLSLPPYLMLQSLVRFIANFNSILYIITFSQYYIP